MTYEQALNRAASMCAQSEHCAAEIRDKAIGWGVMGEDLDTLIQYLVSEGYLDDGRYARAFVNDKFRYQHWGRVKIRYALRGREIDDVLINQAMEEKIDADEYQKVCDEVVAAKLRGMKLPLTANDRAKVFRFAAQRGFESGVIGRSLRNCQCDTDNDD